MNKFCRYFFQLSLILLCTVFGVGLCIAAPPGYVASKYCNVNKFTLTDYCGDGQWWLAEETKKGASKDPRMAGCYTHSARLIGRPYVCENGQIKESLFACHNTYDPEGNLIQFRVELNKGLKLHFLGDPENPLVWYDELLPDGTSERVFFNADKYAHLPCDDRTAILSKLHQNRPPRPTSNCINGPSLSGPPRLRNSGLSVRNGKKPGVVVGPSTGGPTTQCDLIIDGKVVRTNNCASGGSKWLNAGKNLGKITECGGVGIDVANATAEGLGCYSRAMNNGIDPVVAATEGAMCGAMSLSPCANIDNLQENFYLNRTKCRDGSDAMEYDPATRLWKCKMNYDRFKKDCYYERAGDGSYSEVGNTFYDWLTRDLPKWCYQRTRFRGVPF